MPTEKDPPIQDVFDESINDKNSSFGDLLEETLASWAQLEQDIKDGKPIPPPAPRIRGLNTIKNYRFEDDRGLEMYIGNEENPDEVATSGDEFTDRICKWLADK